MKADRLAILSSKAHDYADSLCADEPENGEIFEKKIAELIVRACATLGEDTDVLM